MADEVRVQFKAAGAHFTFEYMDKLEAKKFRVKANGGIATVSKEQWEIMKKHRLCGLEFQMASKAAMPKNPHEVEMQGVKPPAAKDKSEPEKK